MAFIYIVQSRLKARNECFSDYLNRSLATYTNDLTTATDIRLKVAAGNQGNEDARVNDE